MVLRTLGAHYFTWRNKREPSREVRTATTTCDAAVDEPGTKFKTRRNPTTTATTTSDKQEATSKKQQATMNLGYLYKALYSDTVIGGIEKRRQKIADKLEKRKNKGKIQDETEQNDNSNGGISQPKLNKQPDNKDRHFRY